MSIIKTENLEKIYKGKGKNAVTTHALRGVSLEIPQGAFACIIGKSGHGKSTLLNLIGGLDNPTAGRVFIYDEDITQLSDNKRAQLRAKKIGFVFQSFNLLENLTALENVQTAMLFAKNKAQNAEDLLALVGLSDKANSKPAQLSGGQQQRVAIARALANSPDILIMDEPTGNLDSQSAEEVLEHILKLHKSGKTIIVVTHNDDLAQKAEMVFEVKDGKLTDS
ncbi:MAG: ABC transporter ATP-binding protein [Oscillospiraceae bacterium]|nr:ABC transporter ATP-binding protein [Oscillospiraceae bacterium]